MIFPLCGFSVHTVFLPGVPRRIGSERQRGATGSMEEAYRFLQDPRTSGGPTYLPMVHAASASWKDAPPTLERRISEALDTGQLAFYPVFEGFLNGPLQMRAFMSIFCSMKIQIPRLGARSLFSWSRKPRVGTWLGYWSCSDSYWKMIFESSFIKKCLPLWPETFRTLSDRLRLQICCEPSRRKMKMTLMLPPLLQIPPLRKLKYATFEDCRGRSYHVPALCRGRGLTLTLRTGLGKLVLSWIVLKGFILLSLRSLRRISCKCLSRQVSHRGYREPATTQPHVRVGTSCLGPKSKGVRRDQTASTKPFSLGRFVLLFVILTGQFSSVTGVRVAASPMGAAEAAQQNHRIDQGSARMGTHSLCQVHRTHVQASVPIDVRVHGLSAVNRGARGTKGDGSLPTLCELRRPAGHSLSPSISVVALPRALCKLQQSAGLDLSRVSPYSHGTVAASRRA